MTFGKFLFETFLDDFFDMHCIESTVENFIIVFEDPLSKLQSNDFEIHVKVPSVGELNVKLHADAWNRLLNRLKPLHWLLASIAGGTIGVHLIRPSIPLTHQLPSTHTTVQNPKP